MADLNEQLRAEPCPCCGSANIEVSILGSDEKCAIGCNDCGLALKWYRPKAEQIARWNRRQHGSAAQAVATLHDDGYFTFKRGMEPERARYAGWRMDVYAAPPVADAEGVTGERVKPWEVRLLENGNMGNESHFKDQEIADWRALSRRPAAASESLNVWERFAQARADVIDALHGKGMTAEAIADSFTFTESQVSVILRRDRSKDFSSNEASSGPAAAAEPGMADCSDCEGSGRISPVELCQRCNESGILPSRTEVAAEQPADGWQVLTDATRFKELLPFDVVLTNGVTLYNQHYNVIDWTQVQDWRYAAAEQPAAEPELLPLPECKWAACDTTDGVQFHPSAEQAKRYASYGESVPYYTAGQMHAYARAHRAIAYRVAIEGCARVCQEVARESVAVPWQAAAMSCVTKVLALKGS